MTDTVTAARVLSKGANVGLADLGDDLGSMTVLVDAGDTSDGRAVDADVSVLLVGSAGRVRSNDDFVFYNQPVALAGAVHLRDRIRLDDAAVSSDVITVDLDGVPDDVVRVVMAASLDPESGLTFGDTDILRLRVQRTSDAGELLSFEITGATTETALMFGEFYRRGEGWRFRAIGQGYANGLAGIATEFGVEIGGDDVEATPAAGGDVVPDDEAAVEESSAAETGGVDETIAAQTVTVRRTVRPPRMPSDWDSSIPTADGNDFTRARLFPVAGIGSAPEQERRAASSFLAVMPLVREFGRTLTKPMGAPAGAMTTYIEVPFGHDDEALRPDGLIVVRRGPRTWQALVEVKTSSASLDPAQIDKYVDLAREKKIDAVVTISNQVTGAGDDHPVTIDRRKLRKVALHHLSWDEIRTHAVLLSRPRSVADPTQRIVLDEFLRYMRHERSGLHGFTSMGRRWTEVRDKAANGTLRASDAGTESVCASFDQLIAHVALHLTGLLGVEVTAVAPRNAPDRVTRRQQLADSGVLFGALRVPGAVDLVVVRVDLRAKKVQASVDVTAPREGRPTTRVNWLVRQVPDAHDSTRIEALLSGSRTSSTAALLGSVRTEPASLAPTDDREIRAFRVSRETAMGPKEGVGRGTLIGSVVDVVTRFYAEVVQNLRPWSARPPRLPEQ